MKSKNIVEQMGRGSQIRRAFEEGNRLRALHGADAVCDLSLGNPVVEPPPAFRLVLREEAARDEPGLHRYMPNAGHAAARQAFAAHLSQVHGRTFSPDHVALSVGAAGGLNSLLKAILEPGDEVLQLSPYFPEYIFYIENHGGVPVPVPTTSDFLPDPTAIARALTPRTRAILINSPNNPTGRVYPAHLLAAIGEVLRAHEARVGRPVLLIADDPYSQLIYDGATVPSPFHAHRHTVLVGCHSKDLAIPGERIGYVAVHPDADGATDLMAAVAFTTRVLGFVNAPALMQRVAARLQGVSVEPAIYQRRRDRLLTALLSMGYECVRPEGAFYLFPKAPGGDDLAFSALLQEHLTLVVPGTGFGTPGYFRIAYCCDEAVLERSIPRFAAAFKAARDQH